VLREYVNHRAGERHGTVPGSGSVRFSVSVVVSVCVVPVDR